MADQQDVTTKVVLDFILLCIVALPSLIFEVAGSPFKRGFFCNDESISHPKKSDTVPLFAVALVGLALPTLVIIICELIRYQRQLKGLSLREEHDSTYVLCKKTVHPFLVTLYIMVGPFLFGAAVSQVSTDITKYSVGRLRPHFITICAPDWSQVQCTDGQGQMRYVEEDVCTGPADYIKEARLSHPSGHSSFSCYTMVYLVLYMQARFKWRGSRLWRHFLQVITLYLTIWVCLSRISDYMHHWSDVLGGALLGTLVAIIVVRFVSTLFQGPKVKDIAKQVTELHNFTSSGNNVDGYGTYNNFTDPKLIQQTQSTTEVPDTYLN